MAKEFAPMRPTHPFAQRLAAVPGVEQVQYRQGQVLVYQGHVPPCVFVVLHGSVRLEDETGRAVHGECFADEADGLLRVLPAPGALSLRAGCTVRAATDLELLVLPRSLFQMDVSLAGLFADPDARTVSLTCKKGGGHAMSAMQCAVPVSPLKRILERAEVRARARLFRLASEILERPPTDENVRAWKERLEALAVVPPAASGAVALLRETLATLRQRAAKRCAAWAEHAQLLEAHGPRAVSLYASGHCDSATLARLNRDSCTYEEGKSCPFGEWYCVGRFGKPCDHAAAALALASRHWNEWAEARERAEEERAAARCRSLVRVNLSKWLGQIADQLFLKARTPLYQAEALLIGALIQEG